MAAQGTVVQAVATLRRIARTVSAPSIMNFASTPSHATAITIVTGYLSNIAIARSHHSAWQLLETRGQHQLHVVHTHHFASFGRRTSGTVKAKQTYRKQPHRWSRAGVNIAGITLTLQQHRRTKSGSERPKPTFPRIVAGGCNRWP